MHALDRTASSDACAPAPARPHADVFARAGNWIVGDDTGMSSKTIWAVMLGLNLPGWCCEPADPDDLGRCLRLLELIPEWKPRIGEMAAVSQSWARMIPHWDRIAASMAKEVGIDWSKGRSAPKTYALMQMIRDGEL